MKHGKKQFKKHGNKHGKHGKYLILYLDALTLTFGPTCWTAIMLLEPGCQACVVKYMAARKNRNLLSYLDGSEAYGTVVEAVAITLCDAKVWLLTN